MKALMRIGSALFVLGTASTAHAQENLKPQVMVNLGLGISRDGPGFDRDHLSQIGSVGLDLYKPGWRLSSLDGSKAVQLRPTGSLRLDLRNLRRLVDPAYYDAEMGSSVTGYSTSGVSWSGAALVGLSVGNRYATGSFGMGIGLGSSTIREQWNSIYGVSDREYTTSVQPIIPLEANLIWTPTPTFGLGLRLFARNATESTGAQLTLHLGDLW